MNWPAGSAGIIGRLGGRWLGWGGIPPERIATALCRGILGREPDLPGLAQKAGALRSADTLEQVIRTFIESPEFRARFLNSLTPQAPLPDLTLLMPDRYETQPVNGAAMTVYHACDDAAITAMVRAIEQHRYYDRFGVWSPVIDLDKQVTAALVRGLGARSCFELGCFTGPVLSLLAEAGLSVAGAEVSHTAFTFAYPNIRDAIIFGDLLTIEIDHRFDVVLCMDVLEHLNPLLLGSYIERLMETLNTDGYLYLNAPMWGRDRNFGVFEEPYLKEWSTVGDAANWWHWPCDGAGWPIHGHLIWASPGWWERKFAEHGLIRDTVVECAIHRSLAALFSSFPGRRSLFVLRRTGSCRSSEADADAVTQALSQIPNLPGSGAASAQSNG